MLRLENQLSNVLNSKRIDWNLARKIIRNNRAFINEFEDEDCDCQTVTIIFPKGVRMHFY